MNKEQTEKILETLESYDERLDILEKAYRIKKRKRPRTNTDTRLDLLQSSSNSSLSLMKMETRDCFDTKKKS